ncbi:hypothetical protein [Rhizobium hidalgonense]|uniref:hypothetical protein n=1 Tax=Rhizobium hidalgonense TaxID=1538159 RepID=UPI0028727FE1|nr:hypothetical protein [Rhizobium hidalgonense]MDR9813114.1 hypothetical protein [Rhizobium hidalgonense]
MLLQAGAGLLGGQTAPEQVAGLAQGVAGVRQRNKTVEKLRAQGATDLADAIESGALSGKDAFQLFYQQKLEAQKPKNNYMAVGKNLYDVNSGQWVAPPAGMAADPAEYGLNPIYGTDADGNTVIGQVDKSGNFHQVDTRGFKPVGTTHNLNLGTTYQTQDRAGNVVATAPIDIAGKNSQEEIGTATGKAIAAAPGDLQAGQNALDTITSLRTDPYKARGTGFSSIGNVIPGTGGYDFSNKVDQAKSGAFLTAIQQMRGLGSLSNAEGGAATAAVNRMNTATSEDEFNSALDDYEKIVRQGMARAQARIQQGGGQVQAPPGLQASPVGATSSGVKWSVEP